MSGLLDIRGRQRHVLPRWVLSSQVGGGVLRIERSPATITTRERAEVDERSKDFRANPTLSTAGDLLSTALVIGTPEAAQEAAEYVAAASTSALGAVDTLAAAVLGGDFREHQLPFPPSPNRSEIISRLRANRDILARDPRNTLAWSDSALLYISIAQPGPAIRAFEMALRLAPRNRYVLRAGARFWAHLDEPDRALSILERSELTESDPWLAASELAVSQLAGRSPQSIRVKRGLLSRHSPQETTELSSALGTIELSTGRDRRARRLFLDSLEEPNENTVAQAEWAAAASLPGLDHPSEDLIGRVRDTYEAMTRHLISQGRVAEAVSAAEAWLDFEPFSAEPAIMGSYLAIVGPRDFEGAQRIARRGLEANPRDPMIANNLAVALASQGDTHRAEAVMGSIDRRDLKERPEFLATEGLIKYRQGDIEGGRRSYGEALGLAEKMGSERTVALASLFWAEEEARTAAVEIDPQLLDFLARAQRVFREGWLPEATAWFNRLISSSDSH